MKLRATFEVEIPVTEHEIVVEGHLDREYIERMAWDAVDRAWLVDWNVIDT